MQIQVQPRLFVVTISSPELTKLQHGDTAEKLKFIDELIQINKKSDQELAREAEVQSMQAQTGNAQQQPE